MSLRINQGDVLVEIRPSLFRRTLSLVAIAAVGILLLRVAVFQPDIALLMRVLMIAAAAGAAALGLAFYRATSVALELTEEEMRDSAGRILFRLDQIERVDRGMFALKPSNGFSVYLKTRGDFAWQPGLWWRIGRRIGIGGATAPSQAKALVETLALIQAGQSDLLRD